MSTQQDQLDAVTAMFQNSGVAGNVVENAANVVFTLSAQQQGQNVVLTVNVPPDQSQKVTSAATLADSTPLYANPDGPPTMAGARMSAYMLLQWWSKQPS